MPKGDSLSGRAQILTGDRQVMEEDRLKRERSSKEKDEIKERVRQQ